MRRLTLLLVAALAATSSAGDGPRLSDEDAADLAWLDGLADAALGGKPFVEVRQGEWFSTRGFLVGQDARRVAVVSAGLQRLEFERSPPGTPDEQRLVVEPLSLRDLAQAWLAGGPSPAKVSAPRPMEDWPHPDEPSLRTRTLVCAWALSHGDRGQDATIVHDALVHARSMRADPWGVDEAAKAWRVRVADDFAAAELFRAKEAIAGSWMVGAVRAKGRAEQLEAFRAVIRRFPGSSSEPEATTFADVLARMIRDAAEHAKSAKPIDSMTPDERRRELVFRLREQQANGFGVNGGPGEITDGPYMELVRGGLDSVPALLEALADDSLTNVGGGGRCDCNPFVERVQQIALQALEQIAGRAFTTTQGLAPKGVPWPFSARPAIEAWYAEARSVGEVESLVRAVERGDWDVWRSAAALLARAPERVPAGLVRALDAPGRHAIVRSQILDLLAKNPGDVGREALRKEAATSGWTNFEAARLLADLGDPSATEFLLARWRERRDGGGPPVTPPEQGVWRRRSDELKTLATALVATKDVAVVRALAEDLGKRAPLAREAVVRAVASARGAATGDLAAAMDAALVDSLDDRMEPEESVDESKPTEGFGPRHCDLAAAALAASRGLAAPKTSDSYAARDALIAAIATAWGRTPAPAGVETATGGGAFDVRAVRFVPDAARVPKALREKIEALLGKPLAASAFADAATAAIATRGSFSLDADRIDAASGVVVTLTLLDGDGPGWAWDLRAIRAGRWIPGDGCWSCDPPRDDGRFARVVETALAVGAAERAWVHVVAIRRSSD